MATQFGMAGLKERKDFSKIQAQIDIPDLIEIQKKSYERFLQMIIRQEQREDIGLQAAFNSVFPISDYNETAMIELMDYTLAYKYDVRECLERGMSAKWPLKIKVRRIHWEKRREDHQQEGRQRRSRNRKSIWGNCP